MDVHGVLHDDRHLGLKLCVADALLEEPCGDGKERLTDSFSGPVLPLLSTHLVWWETCWPILWRTPFLLRPQPAALVEKICREQSSELLKRGQNFRLSSPTLTPGPAAAKEALPKGLLQDGVWRGGSREDHFTHAGPAPGSAGAGPWREALLFRWLTSARILSSFSLFRTLELSPCSRLRKAASASRSRLSRSMRTFTSA